LDVPKMWQNKRLQQHKKQLKDERSNCAVE
jgi:hypothetical protein